MGIIDEPMEELSVGPETERKRYRELRKRYRVLNCELDCKSFKCKAQGITFSSFNTSVYNLLGAVDPCEALF